MAVLTAGIAASYLSTTTIAAPIVCEEIRLSGSSRGLNTTMRFREIPEDLSTLLRLHRVVYICYL